MGAFGELLIQSWGGDLNSYRGNTSNSTKTFVDKTTEEEKKQFRYERKIQLARDTLDLLKSKVMYEPQHIKNFTEDIIKKYFKQLGYDENIQNIMWNEYLEYLSKYEDAIYL